MISLHNNINKALDGDKFALCSMEQIPDTYCSFSVSVKTDQSGSLFIYQSFDGREYHSTQKIDGIVGEFYRIFHKKAAYVQIGFQNMSGIADDNFALQTIFTNSNPVSAVVSSNSSNSSNQDLKPDPVTHILFDNIMVQNDVSESLSTTNYRTCYVYGTCDQNCTINIEFSNGNQFYPTGYSIIIPQPGEFASMIPIAYKLVQFKIQGSTLLNLSCDLA